MSAGTSSTKYPTINLSRRPEFRTDPTCLVHILIEAFEALRARLAKRIFEQFRIGAREDYSWTKHRPDRAPPKRRLETDPAMAPKLLPVYAKISDVRINTFAPSARRSLFL